MWDAIILHNLAVRKPFTRAARNHHAFLFSKVMTSRLQKFEGSIAFCILSVRLFAGPPVNMNKVNHSEELHRKSM